MVSLIVTLANWFYPIVAASVVQLMTCSTNQNSEVSFNESARCAMPAKDNDTDMRQRVATAIHLGTLRVQTKESDVDVRQK